MISVSLLKLVLIVWVGLFQNLIFNADMLETFSNSKANYSSLADISKVNKFVKKCRKKGNISNISNIVIKLSSYWKLIVSCSLPVKGHLGDGWISVSIVTEDSAHHEMSISLREKDIKQLCIAADIWQQNNPGVVMAKCLLSNGFRANFVDSTSSHVYDYSILKSSDLRVNRSRLNSMKCEDIQLKSERFNVYGPVRILQNALDDWYIKNKVHRKQCSMSDVKLAHKTIVQSNSAAIDVISFHYVEYLEAALLYRLLSSNKSVLHSMSNRQLFELWPKSSREIGGYSMRINTLIEARSLLNYLQSVRDNLT